MSGAANVLLCDDHKLFREGLKALLAQADNDVSVVGEAADGIAVMDEIATCSPDVVLLDIMMPGMDGLTAAAEIRRRFPEVRIVLLTTRKDPTAVNGAMAAGAHGYLLKDDAFEELVGAIRSVMRGETYVSGSLAGGLLREQRASATAHKLSPREQEVLALVAKSFRNQEIADRLGVSLSTIRTHRARLMEKLDAHSSADLVRYAIEQGLA